MSSDEAIQLTNNDASNFKAYAVNKGYWHDPYIHYFVSSLSIKQSPQSINEHKPPEMSRGYFARVNAIHTLVNKFMNKFLNEKCQIVNLGCGYDTLYFNLVDKYAVDFKFVEVDMNRIVQSKIRLIKSKQALSDKIIKNDGENNDEVKVEQPKSNSLFALPLPLTSSAPPTSELHSLKYDIVSADLRNVKDLDKKLRACNIDFSLPTLVIFECVLVYMTSENSHELLSYLNTNFSSLCLVNYEQANLNDKFGEVMLNNMQHRACTLLGVDVCQSIQSQMERFQKAGFHADQIKIMTMTDYYNNKLEEKERRRIESVEFLDEINLFFQLMDHYCICLVTNNSIQFKNFNL